MAVNASKTWIAGEVLTASDLNGEFTNILSNGQIIGFPRTAEAHFKGQVLWLDADKDSSLTADTDDRLDLALSGTDLFRWDGTATTPVNGFDWIAADAGSEPAMAAVGADTDINVELTPKGAGTGTVGGVRIILVGDTEISHETDDAILAGQVFGFG
jgi:hypothetical protein